VEVWDPDACKIRKDLAYQVPTNKQRPHGRGHTGRCAVILVKQDHEVATTDNAF
jgi:hypothetical protein